MTECRWLDAEDLVAWRDLRAEALRAQPDAFLTTLAEFQASSDAHVRGQLAQGRVVGAWQNGTLVGSVAYLRKSRPSTAHRAALEAVFLRESARGTGVADAMLDAVEARAAREGVDQLELMVWDGNARAIGFYERRGFAQMGRMPRAVVVDGAARDDFFYVRAL